MPVHVPRTPTLHLLRSRTMTVLWMPPTASGQEALPEGIRCALMRADYATTTTTAMEPAKTVFQEENEVWRAQAGVEWPVGRADELDVWRLQVRQSR
ncbi:hypothetical protein EDD85DRAFT_821752 [Armillaria nabsnona]|nr:hypothetical protein EDD85DRAFT_821752 [Armillaria nabsnona]